METKKLDGKIKLPLDDGTGNIKDVVAEEGQAQLKSAEDELNNSVKIISEINEGPNLKEKLILSVKNEDMLTEDLTKEISVSDLIFKAIIKVVSDLIQDEDYIVDNKELFTSIDQAKEKLEDLMGDGTLEEALPPDLIRVYKSNKYGYKPLKRGVGAGSKPARAFSGFGDIKQNRVIANPKPVKYDFNNSFAEEITPEQAISLKNQGQADTIQVIFDGQLITFNEDGKQVYIAQRSYKSPRELYQKPNGDLVEYSSKLTFNTIMNRADKIYKVSIEEPDKDLRAKRADNPESRYYRGKRTSRDLIGNQYDYSTKSIDDLTLELQSAKNRISEYVSEIEADENRLKSDDNQYYRDYILSNIELYKKRKRNAERTVSRLETAIKDKKASIRNEYSNLDARKTFEKYKELKSDINNLSVNVKSAENRFNNIKEKGTPEFARTKERIKEIQEEIAKLKKELVAQEINLSAEEDLAEPELKAAEAALKEITDNYEKAKSDLDTLLKRKTVPVEEDLVVTMDFSSYEPWGPAESTYTRIEDEDKLEEFESLMEELYPDGIDETSLNDILAYDSDWVFDMLGMDQED